MEFVTGAPAVTYGPEYISLNETIQLCMMRHDELHRLRLLSICTRKRHIISNSICIPFHKSNHTWIIILKTIMRIMPAYISNKDAHQVINMVLAFQMV